MVFPPEPRGHDLIVRGLQLDGRGRPGISQAMRLALEVNWWLGGQNVLISMVYWYFPSLSHFTMQLFYLVLFLFYNVIVLSLLFVVHQVWPRKVSKSNSWGFLHAATLEPSWAEAWNRLATVPSPSLGRNWWALKLWLGDRWTICLGTTTIHSKRSTRQLEMGFRKDARTHGKGMKVAVSKSPFSSPVFVGFSPVPSNFYMGFLETWSHNTLNIYDSTCVQQKNTDETDGNGREAWPLPCQTLELQPRHFGALSGKGAEELGVIWYFRLNRQQDEDKLQSDQMNYHDLEVLIDVFCICSLHPNHFRQLYRFSVLEVAALPKCYWSALDGFGWQWVWLDVVVVRGIVVGDDSSVNEML